jgi:hypothetical protein
VPYTPLSIPADGNVLSASTLNTLNANAEFLYSLISGVNTPFATHSFDGTPDPETSRPYIMRRQARYLHVRVDLTSNDVSDFDILIDGVSVYNDGTNRSASYTWEIAIDLTGIGSPPAVGDFYEIVVELDWSVGGTARFVYALESDSATL